MKISINLWLFFFSIILFTCAEDKQENIQKQEESQKTTTIHTEKKRDEVVFDSAGWLLADSQQRTKYINDLMRNDILVTLSENEITKLLGKPDEKIENILFYDLKYVFDKAGSLKERSLCIELRNQKNNLVYVSD